MTIQHEHSQLSFSLESQIFPMNPSSPPPSTSRQPPPCNSACPTLSTNSSKHRQRQLRFISLIPIHTSTMHPTPPSRTLTRTPPPQSIYSRTILLPQKHQSI